MIGRAKSAHHSPAMKFLVQQDAGEQGKHQHQQYAANGRTQIFENHPAIIRPPEEYLPDVFQPGKKQSLRPVN